MFLGHSTRNVMNEDSHSDADNISDPFNTDGEEEYQPSEFDNTNSETSSSSSKRDSTNVVEKSGKDNSPILDISVNEMGIGEAIRESTSTIVRPSNSGTKKYSCKYCHKLVAKLSRHIETVHKDCEEVKKLSLIPRTVRKRNEPITASARERLEIIKKIRTKGNFEHNIKCSTSDTYIPSRRPQSKKAPKFVSDFAACPLCKDFFSNSTLHRHFKKCSGKCSKNNRKIKALSRAVMGNVHEKADSQLRNIICRMRDDEITSVVRFDELIILFGNLEAFKYRHSQHHGKMIRAKLRRLGRLLLELRKVEEKISDFSSLFDPSYFSSFLKAVNNMGNFNAERDLFDTPATASALGLLTKELAEIWIANCIEKKDGESKKNAEDFLHLYKIKFGKLINKTVSESQTENQIKKKITLPSLTDIKKLHVYLTKERRKKYNEIQEKGFNMVTWKELLETTMISIQLLNRRRPGEIERIKMVHYGSLERIDEKSNLDLYNTLNPRAKDIANKYSRILLRGKLNRTVPVLLTQEMVESLEMLIKYRKDAKVPKRNPYLFGIPGGPMEQEKCPSACEIMRKFSIACRAQVPSTLRGTLLRKHVATCCISLNLTDGEVEDLSKFMGHDKNIHLNIYRQPVATKDILQISQLLEKAQGGDLNEPESGLMDIDNNAVPGRCKIDVTFYMILYLISFQKLMLLQEAKRI